MGDDPTNYILAIFSGSLALMAFVGLVYIIIDEIVRFKREQRRLEERTKESNDGRNR